MKLYIVNSTGTITSCNGIRRITAASTCSTSRRKTFGDRISSFTTSKLIYYTTFVFFFLYKSGSRSKYVIRILNSFDNNNEQYNPIWSARLAHVRNIVPMATLRWRCLPKPPCTIAGWLSGSRRPSTNPVARSMSNISHSTNRRACSNSAVGHTTDSRSRSRTLLFILTVLQGEDLYNCYYYVTHCPGGSATFRGEIRFYRRWNGRRFERVLHVGRMGHSSRSGNEKHEILHVLRRTLFRYYVQHHHEAKDAVLHGQSHHSLHWHHISDRFGFLFAIRFRREGNYTASPPPIIIIIPYCCAPIFLNITWLSLGGLLLSITRLMVAGEFGHIDPPVIDRVLPFAGRDYSTNQFGCSALGQVRTLHHDPRHV